MTDTEDNEKGTLTVNVNYAKAAQHIHGAIHFLQKVLEDLDKAALEKKIDKRKHDRASVKSNGNPGAWP